MKVIFLDIDGVLNTYESLEAAYDVDPGSNFTSDGWLLKCVKQLKRIIRETGAKIVISSSWRIGHEEALREGFERFDIPMWIDTTPYKMSLSHRGTEIAWWLEGRDDIDRYVILDDDGRMNDDQKPFFVQTHWRKGSLTKQHADEAIRILNQ